MKETQQRSLTNTGILRLHDQNSLSWIYPHITLCFSCREVFEDLLINDPSVTSAPFQPCWRIVQQVNDHLEKVQEWAVCAGHPWQKATHSHQFSVLPPASASSDKFVWLQINELNVKYRPSKNFSVVVTRLVHVRETLLLALRGK